MSIEQISSGGTTTYLHHDQQGSTRLLTGSAGTITGKCTYGAYGAPTCEGTVTSPLGYDGQYTSSDTGLIYMRAREYDPSTAQFLSVDPLIGLTRAPYGYTSENPLNEADLTGLCGTELFGPPGPGGFGGSGASGSGWGAGGGSGSGPGGAGGPGSGAGGPGGPGSPGGSSFGPGPGKETIVEGYPPNPRTERSPTEEGNKKRCLPGQIVIAGKCQQPKPPITITLPSGPTGGVPSEVPVQEVPIIPIPGWPPWLPEPLPDF
jgi:RHS repeat-associated protein